MEEAVEPNTAAEDGDVFPPPSLRGRSHVPRVPNTVNDPVFTEATVANAYENTGVEEVFD